MNIIIYGAGQTGEQIFNNIKGYHNIVAFLDGNPEKKGQYVGGVEIIGDLECLDNIEYDLIYIGTTFWKDVKRKLLDYGIKEEKIVVEIPETLNSPIREKWLEGYAKLHINHNGAVAEAGVYRGDFASIINRCFPKLQLHLFDTFEGFDERDIMVEKEKMFSNPEEDNFSNTSVDLVMSKMLYPEKVYIHKGFFPNTVAGLDDKYVFVNLDFDLYQPILEGLRFFYPRMIEGTVLLVHDYYHAGLPGVKLAIEEYEKEIDKMIVKLPIGDGQSIALIK